jgi:hypothetical protein
LAYPVSATIGTLRSARMRRVASTPSSSGRVEVDQNQVRGVLSGERDRLGPAPSGGADLEAVVLEDQAQVGADDRIVLRRSGWKVQTSSWAPFATKKTPARMPGAFEGLYLARQFRRPLRSA